MRVRILKSAEGIMDGVSLAHLVPDTIYELDPIVAHYLITTRHAEVPPHSEHALVIPLDNPRAYSQLTRGVTVIPPLAEAADQPPRRRRSVKKR
jgi:hypothetical protein